MKTRWERFYTAQMKDKRLRSLVERELESLALGMQIARLRQKGKLSQTKLAALAEMSAPKISAIENEPRNVTVGTLIRIANALGSKLEIRLVPQKAGASGRRRRTARAA